MISIIIPIYNVENYLDKCLKSIQSQIKVNDWEVILIDDESTDCSAQIAKKWTEIDYRFKYHFKKNGGPSAARNMGIRLAKGQHIMFLDSDDFWENNLLLKLQDKLNSAEMICFNYYKYSKNDVVKCDSVTSGLQTKEEFLENCEKNLNTVYYNKIYNKVYNSEIIKKNNIYFNEKIKMGEDLLFNLAYFSMCNRFLFLDEYLYYYRIDNTSSLMNSYKSTNNIVQTIEMVKCVEEFFNKNFKDVSLIKSGIDRYIIDSLLTLSEGYIRNKMPNNKARMCKDILCLYCKHFSVKTFGKFKYSGLIKVAWKFKSGYVLLFRYKIIQLRYRLIMKIRGRTR